MNYFTSDWHLGDKREVNGINLLQRSLNSTDQYQAILSGLTKIPSDSVLWHLGDVVYDTNALPVLEEMVEYLRGKNIEFNLIIGNYDEDKLDKVAPFFDRIYDSHIISMGDQDFYLDHYPSRCMEQYMFSLTGHIHGLWKVQRDMINVGIDVNWYQPMSEDMIFFLKNGIENHFDRNVFLS